MEATEPTPTLCTSCGHSLSVHIQVRSLGQVAGRCVICECVGYKAPRGIGGGAMINKEPCRRCGHRADYHNQFGAHPCGRGECLCEVLAIPLLAKPREIGVGITPDKFSLPIFVAGTHPLVCFGCAEPIEPGATFIRRIYCVEGENNYWYAKQSKKRVPFCSTCCPFSTEGVKS